MSMTTSETTKINDKVFKLRRFINTLKIDTNDIIDSYVGQVFNCGIPKQKVFKEFLIGQISDDMAREIGKACSSAGLVSFRDQRSPEAYACELVIGWLFEDAIYLLLEAHDYHPRLSGTDRNREFLAGTRVSSTSDFVITLNGVERSLEVVADYTNWWGRKNKCDLRHSKAKSSEIILGVSMQKPSYFVVDFRSPQESVVLTESAWHEGWDKPAVSLEGIASIMKPFKNGLLL